MGIRKMTKLQKFRAMLVAQGLSKEEIKIELDRIKYPNGKPQVTSSRGALMPSMCRNQYRMNEKDYEILKTLVEFDGVSVRTDASIEKRSIQRRLRAIVNDRGAGEDVVIGIKDDLIYLWSLSRCGWRRHLYPDIQALCESHVIEYPMRGAASSLNDMIKLEPEPLVYAPPQPKRKRQDYTLGVQNLTGGPLKYTPQVDNTPIPMYDSNTGTLVYPEGVPKKPIPSIVRAIMDSKFITQDKKPLGVRSALTENGFNEEEITQVLEELFGNGGTDAQNSITSPN